MLNFEKFFTICFLQRSQTEWEICNIDFNVERVLFCNTYTNMVNKYFGGDKHVHKA